MDDETITPLPDPREFLSKQPKKGILKATSSFDKDRKKHHEEQVPSSDLRCSPPREAHFDEMNIIQTYHPEGKDYGHTKIDEPKTPYHAFSDSEGEEGTSEGVRRVSISEPVCIDFDPNELKARMLQAKDAKPRALASDEESGAEDLEETEEEREKRRQFEMKRKKHYNEFQAVKLAKQLMEDDEKEIVHSPVDANAPSDKSPQDISTQMS